jgi:hypothetical protein
MASCLHLKAPFPVASDIGVTYNSPRRTSTSPRTVAFTVEARNEETPKEQLKSREKTMQAFGSR